MLRNPGLRKSVEQPVLDLNFAASQIGSNGAPDARMNDFNRGSNAWFVDSDGLVKKSPHNVLQQSQTFDTTWGETGCSVTANSINAPDGTLTGYKLIKNAAFGFASLSQNATLTVTAGRATVTVYAKADERDKIALREGAVTGGYAAFDLTNGTILDETNVNEASITSVGNGWFRILIDVTLSSGTTFGVRIVPLPDSYTSGSVTASFSDDGTSGVYIWGSQASEHSYDLLPVGNPYIKTEGSAVYAARLDHDPTWFKSEAQEQNLLQYSEMLDDSYWTKSAVNVTANAETDPLGGTTAEYVFATSPSGIFPAVVVNFDVAKGVVHTLSFYAKKGERDQIHVDNQNPGPVFNENVISNAELTSEWQRFTGTFTPDENTSRLAFYFGSGAKTWTGDQGFYLWGLQVEVGSTASTYHRTTGAPYYGPGATPKGLLIEEARTNLVDDSEDFTSSQFVAVRVTLTADSSIAPDGTNTASEVVPNTESNTHLIRWDDSVVSGTTYTASVFVKQASGDANIRLFFNNSNGGFAFSAANFDLSAGTVNNLSCDSASIEDYGNGWFRCSITEAAIASVTGRIQINVTDSTGENNYAGDGTTGVFIWGFQVEADSFPTSYIQTTGSTATRNADVAVMGPTTGGTELVTNGTFDTDTTGWSVGVTSGTTATVSSGVVTLSASTASGAGMLYQSAANTPTVIGRRYRATAELSVVSGSGVSLVVYSSFFSGLLGSSNITSGTDRTVTVDFTATTTAAHIAIQRLTSYADTDEYKVDNVSVRELYPFEQYNPAEGTLVAEGELIGSGSGFSSVIALYQEDADDTHFINTFWDSGNSIIKASIKDSTTQGNPTPSVGGDTWDGGDSFRVANLYKENSLNIALDGYIGVDDTSATIPGVDRLGIFQASINFQGVKHSGYMKRVTYYNRRISNIAAQNLTSD